MFGLGTKEIVILAVAGILLFGTKRIPELAKGIVEAINHFRNAFKNNPEDDKIDVRKK